jgi:hypothetical protein
VTAGRLAACALLVVAGAVAGAAGALVQAGWFPGGLLLALLALAGLCYGGVKATGSRTGGVCGGVGWLVVVLLLTTMRPEGDFLFAAGLSSYVFLFGGVMTAVMCTTLPKVPSHLSSSGQPPARPGK